MSKLSKYGLARLIGYLERVHALNLSESSISDIDDIVDVPFVEPETPPKVYASVEEVDILLFQMQKILNNDQDYDKIAAIRAYRNLTHAGLKESKDAVEKYSERRMRLATLRSPFAP